MWFDLFCVKIRPRLLFVLLSTSLIFIQGSGANELEETFQFILQNAQENSPEIQTLKLQVQGKKAQFWSAVARGLPRVDLNLSNTLTKDFSFITGGAFGDAANLFKPQEIKLNRWDLNLNFPILRYSTWLGLTQANLEETEVERQLKFKLAETGAKMRELFQNWLLAFYREKVLASNLVLAQETFKDTKLKYELGQITKIEKLRAAANLTSIESQQSSLNLERTLTFNKILEGTGLTKEQFESPKILTNNNYPDEQLLQQIEDFSQTSFLVGKWNTKFQKIVDIEKYLQEDVIPTSPQFLQILSEKESSVGRSRQLMANEFPELVFRAGLNKQGKEINDLFNGDYQSYSLVFALNIPLFTGGSLWSTYREMAANQKVLLLKYEKDLLNLKNELLQTILKVEQLQKATESLGEAVEQFEEILKLSMRSYKLGKAPLIELLNAQRDTIENKFRWSQSRIEMNHQMRKFAYLTGENNE